MTTRDGWRSRFFEDFAVGDVDHHPLGRTVIKASSASRLGPSCPEGFPPFKPPATAPAGYYANRLYRGRRQAMDRPQRA